MYLLLLALGAVAFLLGLRVFPGWARDDREAKFVFTGALTGLAIGLDLWALFTFLS